MRPSTARLICRPGACSSIYALRIAGMPRQSRWACSACTVFTTSQRTKVELHESPKCDAAAVRLHLENDRAYAASGRLCARAGSPESAEFEPGLDVGFLRHAKYSGALADGALNEWPAQLVHKPARAVRRMRPHGVVSRWFENRPAGTAAGLAIHASRIDNLMRVSRMRK